MFNIHSIVRNASNDVDRQEARNPVDVHVGSRVRSRRIALDFSKKELGAALGGTAETMQKFESGATRIGAKRLLEICNLLKCSPSTFFEGIQIRADHQTASGMAHSEHASLEQVELMESPYSIPGLTRRRQARPGGSMLTPGSAPAVLKKNA
jgi:transcriptional regulator with XRE-family HTH domain